MALLELSIVGAISSIIVQLVKERIADGLPRAGTAIVISLIAGGLAYLVGFLPALKEALIGVVILSNIVYQVLIKNLIPKE